MGENLKIKEQTIPEMESCGGFGNENADVHVEEKVVDRVAFGSYFVP